MFIAITHSKAGQRCMVRMDEYTVPFNSEGQAQAFVSLLRQRIEAPHPLPRLPPEAPKPDIRSGKRPVKRSAVSA
ncbi:hypothetical protein [Pseudomonas turukhanskensis]|uniref:Uncharacterized protein n=1 Tax=Pseudomonas turukhanskensis TaxID=1806536 RepID=A0A9W6NFC4_9PSED|nr:hypothetical protein [Pseudomonas turukhanskensis]GLK88496.1 hypothetical protein GCM10017655_15580 [Pseudomonas turukhanskensis]